jgi:hypothetical protein
VWHQFHVWLDASTWHWAMIEIGGAVLLILLICLIAAAVRGGGGSGYSHKQAEADQRARADATMRNIGSDYSQLNENMRRTADDWRKRH